MTVRRAHWLIFLGVVLVVPWPMRLIAPVFAPAAHYLLLAGVVAAVIVAEGSGGPVPAIFGVFLGSALASLLASWLVASVTTRAVLARLSPSVRRRVVYVVLIVGLVLAVAVGGYRTPFSRLQSGNLLQALS